MGPPSAKQINVNDSLDEQLACKHFLCKTVEQAELLFRENALYYQEALGWMGPVAFRYYIFAFIRYVQSEHSAGDADAVSCIAGILEQRIEKARDVSSIAGALSDACRYVLEHYDRFDIKPNIYGDLRPRYKSLISRFHDVHVG
jgi:hypothetical protein